MTYYRPTPTAKDLGILDPELRGIISLLPDTVETAETSDVVVNFMRAIPPRPHSDPEIEKKDIHVSTADAPRDQPPTAVRLYIPRNAVVKGPVPVVLWSVSFQRPSFGRLND